MKKKIQYYIQKTSGPLRPLFQPIESYFGSVSRQFQLRIDRGFGLVRDEVIHQAYNILNSITDFKELTLLKSSSTCIQAQFYFTQSKRVSEPEKITRLTEVCLKLMTILIDNNFPQNTLEIINYNIELNKKAQWPNQVIIESEIDSDELDYFSIDLQKGKRVMFEFTFNIRSADQNLGESNSGRNNRVNENQINEFIKIKIEAQKILLLKY